MPKPKENVKKKFATSQKLKRKDKNVWPEAGNFVEKGPFMFVPLDPWINFWSWSFVKKYEKTWYNHEIGKILKNTQFMIIDYLIEGAKSFID